MLRFTHTIIDTQFDCVVFDVCNKTRRRAFSLESPTQALFVLPEDSDEGSPAHEVPAASTNGTQEEGIELTEDDLIVEKMAITYGGKRGKHPVEMVRNNGVFCCEQLDCKMHSTTHTDCDLYRLLLLSPIVDALLSQGCRN